MHAAYSKLTQAQVLALLNQRAPDMVKVWSMPSLTEARAKLLQLARTTTGRQQALILTDPAQPQSAPNDDLAFISAGHAGQLCQAIANSPERLAALVVKYDQASAFYYKKVRELSSAEGAVLIWDALDIAFEQSPVWPKNSQPDLIGFKLDNAIWLGAKQDMLGEI